MKKVLAVILCVCIALTLTVAAMAAASPEAKIIIRKGTATKNQDGSTIPADTFVEIAEDGTITVIADEAKYGKFINWSVYVISDVTGVSAGTPFGAGAAKILNLATESKATNAKEGTDYTIVEGSLTAKKMTVRPISKIAICGNYYNAKGEATITDPLSASDVPGKIDKSSKTNDFGILYAAVIMLAAGALIFGAKRQLSK